MTIVSLKFIAQNDLQSNKDHTPVTIRPIARNAHLLQEAEEGKSLLSDSNLIFCEGTSDNQQKSSPLNRKRKKNFGKSLGPI